MRTNRSLRFLLVAFALSALGACADDDDAPAAFVPAAGEDQEDFGPDSEEGGDPFESETRELDLEDPLEPEEGGGTIDGADDPDEDGTVHPSDPTDDDDVTAPSSSSSGGSSSGSGATATRKTPLKPFRVMTYNVRHPTSEDRGKYEWDNRKGKVVARILANKPDVVGVQEASSGAAGDLIRGLTGAKKPYAVYRPSKSGSPKLIFYRKARFVVATGVGRGNRSLPNPYKKSNGCYDNAAGRRAAWFGLRDRASSEVFVVVNAHIAHSAKCETGRLAQAKEIKELIETKHAKGRHVIVMGDLNTDPQSGPTKGERTVAIIESAGVKRTAKVVGATSKDEATYNSNWKKTGWKSSARLDWIFHSGGEIASSSPKIDRTRVDGITPSDHFAVLATIKLK